MELTLSQINATKGIAILMMICLHLFSTLDYKGLFQPLIFVGSIPLCYYISLFCDCCVAIYCFCSGYGLYIGYSRSTSNYNRKNQFRLLKLYLNYWIVLLLFAVGLGLLLGKTVIYPGSILKFTLNFTAINPSYNGSWWFVTTYILLVLSSSLLFKIIQKMDYRIVLLFSFVLYAIAYIQRIKVPLQINQVFLDGVLQQLALLGTSQFPFVIGAIAFKQKWFSVFSEYLNKFSAKNIALLLVICLAIIFHGFIPSLFVAVFTGFVFIFCFNALGLPQVLDKIFHYLGKHSTNLWLIHMFFYLIFFKEIIYAPKYPILIYIWLLFWSLLASHFVNLFYKPILNWLNQKIKNDISVV